MTSASMFANLYPGRAIPRDQVPRLSLSDFQKSIVDSVNAGHRVVSLFGHLPDPEGFIDLYAVIADSDHALLRVGMTRLESDSYPSITPECPQVHLFEREIAEQFGVKPIGHPWFKPVRFHSAYRPGHDAWGRDPSKHPLIGETDYYKVDGEEIHEVAVGPIHAGVIEPGHFRFQCHGEQVFHLEISLGYQHRGIERRFIGGPDKTTVHLIETMAGDSSVAHATAYSQSVESLSGHGAPLRAQAIRGIALELERLASHTGDLGALAGDVGFLPTASYCGRLRGDWLNLTALLCGNRFGRGLVRPGGVRFDLEPSRIEQSQKRVDTAISDVTGAATLLLENLTVQSRFEGAGSVERNDAIALGLVGPAARACGLEIDVRHDFPSGIFRFAQIPLSVWSTGDVFARAYVRWLEIQRSVTFIKDQLRVLPEGPIRAEVGAMRPDHIVASLVEGWRGEVCHVAMTDERGKFARYKVVDPSFHNWMGLAMSLRDEQISDFPICNKSFNLSYCGHDL